MKRYFLASVVTALMAMANVVEAQVTWSGAGFGVYVPDNVGQLNVTQDTDSLKQMENEQVTLLLEMMPRPVNNESALGQYLGNRVVSMQPHYSMNVNYQCSWAGFYNGVMVDTRITVDGVEKCYTMAVWPVYSTHHYAAVTVVTDVALDGIGRSIVNSYFTMPLEKAEYDGNMFLIGDATVLYRDLYRTISYGLSIFDEAADNEVMSQMANAFQAVYGISTQSFREEMVEPDVTVHAKGEGEFLCRVTRLRSGDYVLALYGHNEEIGQIPFAAGICDVNTSPDGETTYTLETNFCKTIFVVNDSKVTLNIIPNDTTLSPEKMTGERVSWRELFQ